SVLVAIFLSHFPLSISYCHFYGPNFSTMLSACCVALLYVLIFTEHMGKLQQIAFEFIPEDENSNVEGPVAEYQPQEDQPSEEISEVPQEEQAPVETPRRPLSKRGRISLKEADINADLIQIPPDEILFQKQYYSIGEVAKWFRVNQSLLRYWETEFDILEPRKNRKGDRFFRPVDVKNLQLIYDLLRRDRK